MRDEVVGRPMRGVDLTSRKGVVSYGMCNAGVWNRD
jgi:hypothetical protein